MLFSKSLFADTQQLLSLIEYVGVGCSGAFVDGRVFIAAESAEMLDFSAGIKQQLTELPENIVKENLLAQSQELSLWIEQKQASTKVRQLTAQMHASIINAYDIVVVPRKQPDLLKARQIYANQCSSCHGAEGFGDGPAAFGMEPPPINFHDI